MSHAAPLTPGDALIHAAALIEATAAALKACHTVDGDWTGEDEARAVHDEEIAAAAALRAIAAQAEAQETRGEWLDDVRRAIRVYAHACQYDKPSVLIASAELEALLATRASEAAPTPIADDLASMTRMFHAACQDLGAINKALGLDPDDGGAEPILEAIEALKRERNQWVDAQFNAASSGEAAPTCKTCGGHGEIGGFVNAESGYQSDPCPDCGEAAAGDVPIWGASTLAQLDASIDGAHDLSGAPHERISELIQQRDEALASQAAPATTVYSPEFVRNKFADYETQILNLREELAARVPDTARDAKQDRTDFDVLADKFGLWAEQREALWALHLANNASRKLKQPITKEWCLNMARLEGDSEIGACDPMKYPRVFVDSAEPGDPLPAEFQEGAFACPICGKATPHEHSGTEIVEHRNALKSIAHAKAFDDAFYDIRDWLRDDVVAQSYVGDAYRTRLIALFDAHETLITMAALAAQPASEQQASEPVGDAKLGKMIWDCQAEQSFLGHSRESCDDTGKARWDRLQRISDYLASQVAPSKQAPHGERIDPLKALACMVLDAESGKTDQINSYAGVLRFVYDAVAASQAAPEAPAAAAHAGATVRYVVIGYGESDNPQATFAQTSDELLDAVLGMIYTSPSDAPEDIREAYRSDLTDDSDEWCGNVWRTEFEIGGIVIYDLGEPVLTAPAPDMAADTNFLDDLRRKIAAAPRRQFESAPGVYTSWLDQDAVLDIFDAARGESV